MSTRNLTHDGLPLEDLSSNSSDSYTNPFGNQNRYTEEDDEEYKLHDLDYSTSDSNTRNSPTITTTLHPTSAAMESPAAALKDNHTGGSSSQLIPSDYDRYPRSMGNSRIASMSSSLAGSRNSLLHNNDDVSQMSSSSQLTNANPFLVDLDFSPFGGYPLSSFPLHIEEEEPDDYLHNPDPILDLEYDKNRFMSDLKNMDKRSAGGLFGLLFILVAAIMIFIVLPVLTYTGVTDHGKPQTYQILTNYEYPTLSAIRTNLVDDDTPDDAKTRKLKDGSLWQLVFSDEFAAEGRTFYEGNEQFWYLADFNYASTKDLEWYDPDLVTTANGSMQLRMDLIKQHDLFYRSGMVHSWNKMCFTQGIMEVSVRLPNYGNVSGLWPGMWSMGNLGRPGYMATTEGVWPYSYEACDAGITPNQSSPDGISYLPGQKLNSCTCSGEDHPNKGTGRGAPEIDVFEGEVDTTVGVGVLSQSLQLAPMDIWYYPDERFIEIYNKSVTSMNTYTGGPFQQAVSLTTTLNTTWYEKGEFDDGQFQKYSFEYLNDRDTGYIRWFVGDDPTMTMHSYLLAPNGNIDWRLISKEPMLMILNLGISNNWAYIDWNAIEFPLIMEIDYVRIYQPNDSISITCDPEDYPTYDYIEDHLTAYENYNHTSWKMAGFEFPKNKLTGC